MNENACAVLRPNSDSAMFVNIGTLFVVSVAVMFYHCDRVRNFSFKKFMEECKN